MNSLLSNFSMHKNIKRVSIIKLFYVSTIIIPSVLFPGCVNTGGDLEIEGKVIDEHTNVAVPWRDIIVQGLIQNDEKLLPIEIGQFSSDSSGRFKYTLSKVKDVRYYNFILVGDSNYAFKTKVLGLYELEKNAKFISFELSKLTNLSIIINARSKKPDYDTLSLSWNSNGVFYWKLFPFEIYNYNESGNCIINSARELRWYGGNVNSVVKTRVFAEKKTKIYWDIYHYGKKLEFIDTITCRRDFVNKIYFSY